MKYTSIGVSLELREYLSYLKGIGVYDSFEELIKDNLDSIKKNAEKRREKYNGYFSGGMRINEPDFKDIKPMRSQVE